MRVETTVYLQCAAKEAFAFVVDFRNNPRWQGGMQETQLIAGTSEEVGAVYQQVAHFLGRRIESTLEVIEIDPGHMMKATTAAGPFPITVTRIVEPEGEGCRVRAIIEGDATGFFKLAEPLMARLVKRSVDADYERLRSLFREQAHQRPGGA